MKKGELKEIVFTALSGGRPSTDVSVLREDIEALIPAAVNYALTGDYWARLNNDNDREFPNNIVTELEIEKVYYDSHGRCFFTIDYNIINISGNSGIRYVQDSLGNSYAPVALGVSRSTFWDKALSCNKEFQLKKQDNKSKIILRNKPEISSSFLVGVILDSSLLTDEDELPIPAGREPEVIDLLLNFYSNQRMQPKDYIINGIDPINKAE